MTFSCHVSSLLQSETVPPPFIVSEDIGVFKSTGLLVYKISLHLDLSESFPVIYFSVCVTTKRHDLKQ